MPAWKILLFVLLVQTPVSLLVHWTIGSRAVHALHLQGAAARGLWAFLAAAMALVLAALLATRAHSDSPFAGLLAWAGFGWLGLAFTLFAGCLAAELLLVAPRTAAAVLGQDLTTFSRAVRGLGLLAGLLGAAWGLRCALGPADARDVHVSVAGLPPEFEGYRIAHLSDTHISAILGATWAADLARRVDSARPDLVVHTGDLVDGSVGARGPAVGELLRARGADGAVFVTGNHESYSGVGDWTRFVSARGWTVLRNSSITLRRGGASLRIVGLPDAREGAAPGGVRPDPARAFSGVRPGECAILLAHEPLQALSAQGRGVALQLSGHTHGGQIWPFHLLVRLQQPVLAGLSRVGDVPVFTSRGVGFWGPPVRLFSPPDLPILVLHRAAAST